MVIKSEKEFKLSLENYKRENPNWLHEMETFTPSNYTTVEKKSEKHSDFFTVMADIMDIFFRG